MRIRNLAVPAPRGHTSVSSADLAEHGIRLQSLWWPEKYFSVQEAVYRHQTSESPPCAKTEQHMQLEVSPEGMSSSDQGGQRTTMVTAEVPVLRKVPRALPSFLRSKTNVTFPLSVIVVEQ